LTKMACCVPMCTTMRNRRLDAKGEKIPLHEFPKDEETKKRWIKNINKKNWIPKVYNKVCGKHFLETDYKPSVKIKMLNPTAVPTVFESFPKALQERAKKNVPRKKPKEREPPQVIIKPDDIYHGINVTEYKKFVQSILDGKEEECLKVLAGQTAQNSQTEKNVVEKGSAVQTEHAVVSTQPTVVLKHPSDTGQELQSNAVDETPFVPNVVGRPKLPESESQRNFRLCQRKLRKARSTLDKLRRQVLQYKKENDALKKSQATFNIDAIVADAEKRNYKAMFLKEMMSHYNKRRVKWDKTVLHLARGWRLKYPDSYSYCKINFFKLPSTTSTNRAFRAEKESSCVVETNDVQPVYHYVLNDFSVVVETEEDYML